MTRLQCFLLSTLSLVLKGSLAARPLSRDRHGFYHSEYVIPFSYLNFSQNATSRPVIMALMPRKEDSAFHAIHLALSDVNKLRNIHLEFVYTVTDCQAGSSTKQLLDMRNSVKLCWILIGCGCETLTGDISEISASWSISQITYSDTHPSLSERQKYTNIFRVVPSAFQFNNARLSILRKFKWETFATLFQDNDFDKSFSISSSQHSLANTNLTTLLRSNYYTVSRFISDPRTPIKEIREKGKRIILANFDDSLKARVFCDAYTLGMAGDTYVWILVDSQFQNTHSSTSDVWASDANVKCTKEQIFKAAKNYLVTNFVELDNSNRKGVSFKSATEYKKEYQNSLRAEASIKLNNFHGYAYDSIWAIGLLWQKIRARDDFSDLLANESKLVKVVSQELPYTDFFGVTGTVRFSNGDRQGLIAVSQFADGSLKTVGVYKAIDDELLTDGFPEFTWG
ncbi:Gamma-aminobutyric acid type B receptor subunit 2, partial [Cichlidogyrus casuarinus]